MSEFIDIFWFTIKTAFASTLLILVPGLAAGWLLARKNFAGKSLLETLFSLPLVLPPVATGFLLLRLIGRNGVIGSFLHQTLNMDLVFTWRAVVIAMCVLSFPLLVRTSRVAFEEVSQRLEFVARTLGAKPWRVFTTITLPLASRGIIAASLLAFARAIGEFGATIIVAGYIPGRTATLSLSIYHYIQLGQDKAAVQLALLSVVPCFVALYLSERYFFNRKRRDAS